MVAVERPAARLASSSMIPLKYRLLSFQLPMRIGSWLVQRLPVVGALGSGAPLRARDFSQSLLVKRASAQDGNARDDTEHPGAR